MKVTTLKNLKENLSKYSEEAASGVTIQITRYNRPFLNLVPAGFDAGLHVGSLVGEGELVAIFSEATGGKFLKFLKEDREDGN